MSNGEQGWHYIMKGTCTECLPPIEVQHKVIALIKIDNDEFVEAPPLSEKIAILEEEKKIAIEAENYERENKIKKEIEKLNGPQS